MCDIIIAADNAKFGQPEIKLGVIPGIGGTQRLTRAVGKAKAMDLILTGRMMDAAEAERSGLVARVVPLASLMDEAMKAAETIASMSLPPLMAAKEAVNRAFETTLAEGVRFERRVFHALFATEDQKEGMAAFVEKRPAKFKNQVAATRPGRATPHRCGSGRGTHTQGASRIRRRRAHSEQLGKPDAVATSARRSPAPASLGGVDAARPVAGVTLLRSRKARIAATGTIVATRRGRRYWRHLRPQRAMPRTRPWPSSAAAPVKPSCGAGSSAVAAAVAPSTVETALPPPWLCGSAMPTSVTSGRLRLVAERRRRQIGRAVDADQREVGGLVLGQQVGVAVAADDDDVAAVGRPAGR